MPTLRTSLVIIPLFMACSAQADTAPKIVGNWVLQNERDPFSDGTTSIAALRNGTDTLALRCFTGKLSVILILPTNKRDFVIGQSVNYDYRSDNGSITKHEGTVFGDYSVELPNNHDVLRDAQQSGQIAFRVSFPGGMVRTLKFAPKNGKTALASVKSGCSTHPASPAPNLARPVVQAVPEQATISASPVDRTSPILDATLDELHKRVFNETADVVAYANECPTIEPNAARIALALLATQKISFEEAANELKTAAAVIRTELVKDVSRNLCAEAWVLFGPLGSRAQNFVVLKKQIESGPKNP